MSDERNYPLFTVIIPQKDRAEYLVHTLKSCMIQDYPNFEIIVSDDCSEDNSVEVVKELQKHDNRIKLFAHEHHLGMRENFEFALSQVRSGYVMALGGDDGLVVGCIWKMYKILKETGRQLLTWPYATFKYANDNEPQTMLYFRRRKSRTVRIIKSEYFLNSIANSFFYLVDECPMFYIKGVVSTELVEKVKSRTKDHCFYHCPTPDGFSGVILCGEVEDYAYTYEPLSIGGNTTKSQGQNYMRTDKKSRKESEQFFNDNIRRTMHKELASQQYSPLIPIMTADYLLTAKDLPGWPGKVGEISIEKLIKVSFAHMSTARYENYTLIRELKILREIAKQHDMLDLFNKLYSQTKRRIVWKNNIYGFALTNSVRFEGTSLGINNVFDASMFIGYAYTTYKKISIKSFFHLIRRTIQILLRQRQYEIEKLPQLDE